jgi:hypothetical protein
VTQTFVRPTLVERESSRAITLAQPGDAPSDVPVARIDPMPA